VTRYVRPPLDAPRIDRRRIPTGLAGTRMTAAHVARLIREGAADFYVRQKAIDILLSCRVAPKDYAGEINALFRWVQRHVRYTKDPFHVEVLHAPRRMLELRAGDCDDMTILLGALLKSVGHPVRLVLTGPDARRPDLFSHIYLEAQCQGDWIPLDATMPFTMGWSPRAPVRLVLSIEEESTHGQRTARTFNPAGTLATAGSSPAARPAAIGGPGPGARGGFSPGSGACPDAAASTGARLAPRLVARDTLGRRAGARSAREGAVGDAATPTGARSEPVDQGDAAPNLEAGTRQSPSTAHHSPDAGAAAGVGSAPAAAPGAVPGRRHHEFRGIPAAATSASRHAAARGDSTAGAPDAGVPGEATASAVPAASMGATAASDAGEKTRTLSGEVQDASALYRRFARLQARSVDRVSHERLVPPVVVELGRLVALMYRSDKWVGHPRTYIHYMEDPPRLVSDVAGRRLFVVGGNYRITARGIEG
jgi:hypothetical protein